MKKRLIEYTDYIKGCVMENKSASAILREMRAKFGKSSPSFTTIKKWRARFISARDGREDIEGYGDHAKIAKKYRDFIRKCVLERKPLFKIYTEMQKTFGKKVPSKSTVLNWVARVRYATQGMVPYNEFKLAKTEYVEPNEYAMSSLQATAMTNNDMPFVKQEYLEENERTPSEARTSSGNSLESVPDGSVSGRVITRSSTRLVRNVEANASRDDVCLRVTPNQGFERGLEPERITDMFVIDGQRFYAIKWRNSMAKDLVLAEIAKQKCPRLVSDYYEEQFAINII